MIRALFLLGIWLAAVGALAAQESNGAVGLGTKPCREITEMSVEPNSRRLLASWMEGYLSGLNYQQVKASKKYMDVGSLTPEAQFEVALSKCKADPSKTFSAALIELAAMLPVKEAGK
jgi:hypothetical protein